ncbi:unnamed protein product [Auanema sp. JU1783]|nr:unnamed protein product [Auanema sp. JU1783]
MRYSGKSGTNSDMTIDVITVKGAGHMVPNDRPGPAVQMITNFLFPTKNGVDYSNQILDPTPQFSKTIYDSFSASFNILGVVSCFIYLFIF